MSLPLLADRDCGDCVECCRFIPLSLPQLSKPTGKLCAYCVDGTGCSVHPVRPQTCRDWFCMWRVVDLSDDWRPDRCGVILRPDGIEAGRMTLYVIRRTPFLESEAFFTTVGHWIEQGFEVGLSVPGPVGTLPVRSVVTDWLGTATRADDHPDFLLRLVSALDTLDRHDFSPDGISEIYEVV